MAGTKTGTWSIVKLSREINRIYSKYGASDLVDRTSQQFADCILGLVVCVVQLSLTDDYLLQKDRTGGAGPEDPI